MRRRYRMVDNSSPEEDADEFWDSDSALEHVSEGRRIQNRGAGRNLEDYIRNAQYGLAQADGARVFMHCLQETDGEINNDGE